MENKCSKEPPEIYIYDEDWSQVGVQVGELEV